MGVGVVLGSLIPSLGVLIDVEAFGVGIEVGVVVGVLTSSFGVLIDVESLRFLLARLVVFVPPVELIFSPFGVGASVCILALILG
jgi:hypothetical protein